MKNCLLNIIEKYLQVFPNEKERQLQLLTYLKSYEDYELIDWNNFDGHVVASGFIYAKDKEKFLVLYHKDLKMYLYPGGHMNLEDKNPQEAAKRETIEETGICNLEQFMLMNDELIPIDIDTHVIEYNKRLKLPKHYHFDFRYLFLVDKIENIKIDQDELENYQWIGMKELKNDMNYGKIALKIEKLLQNKI